METVKVRALASFTEFTPSGMIVFNAPKGDAPGTEDYLSVKRAGERFEAGQVEYVDADAAPISPPVPKSPESGGGESPSPFTMTHKGFGKYLIEGPGINPDTIVQGRKDALEYIGLAEKLHTEVDAALAGDDQDAPV